MRIAFITAAIVSHVIAFGQATNFISAAGEMNFSGAQIVTESGDEGNNIVRFAPWFNLQVYNNTDYRNHGFFIGLSVRNIGFIYEKDDEKWKVRNYAAGIPLGLKWGDMKGSFVYAGYEFEVPLHYKEKYFKGEDKERKNSVWFSDRVSPFTHAGFVGFNFKGGFNVKFKYYFTEFFNPEFNNSGITDARDIRYPGKGKAGDADYVPAREYLKVNVLYMALAWDMFKRPTTYTFYEKKESTQSVY